MSMPSLRARQKEARRAQMLEAARTLFLSNGYGKSSIEAIAEAAEVGVATVYTYFETKEGLAAAIIRKDVGQTIDEAQTLAKSLFHDPVEAVLAIVSVFSDFKRYISAELLKEFIIQSKQDSRIHEELGWAHESQVELIQGVLVKGQDDGRILQSVDPRLAAELIIDLLDRHISRLTTSSDPSIFVGKLEDYIRFLFKNWTCGLA